MPEGWQGPIQTAVCHNLQGLWRQWGGKQLCLRDGRKEAMRDKWSAAQFWAPAICSATIEKSKWAVKNHKQCSKCITKGSLADPLLIAATTPVLSHWNLVVLWAIWGPHTAPARTIRIIQPSSHSAIASHTLDSLSSGRRASSLEVSKRIPKNSSTGMGPTTFSKARGNAQELTHLDDYVQITVAFRGARSANQLLENHPGNAIRWSGHCQ